MFISAFRYLLYKKGFYETLPLGDEKEYFFMDFFLSYQLVYDGMLFLVACCWSKDFLCYEIVLKS